MRTNPLGTPIYTHTLRSAQYPLDKTKSRVRGSYHSGLQSLTTMETIHNTREGGASLSPVVAGTPVTMSTLTSDLGQTHHMASEPGPGPRNHKAAVAAGDTQSDGAFRRPDIQAQDVHPFSSPGASQQTASSEQSTAFGGGQGYTSPTHIRDQIDGSRPMIEPRYPGIATGPSLGSCTTSQDIIRFLRITAVQMVCRML